MTTFSITPPTPSDAEGMNEVIEQSWYATYVNSIVGVTREDIDAQYEKSELRQLEAFRYRAEFPSDTDKTFIAKEESKVVGVIRTKIFDDHVRVRTIYVHPDFIGKGIGTDLWNEMRKIIPRDRPVLAYPVLHTKSVDWYLKMGFMNTGEMSTDSEAMPISGTRFTVVKMQYNHAP